MDLNTLTQFLVVARLEHLSRAADELRIAQPPLSRSIARLESELGAPLFDRAGRLRLNDAGNLFRGYVERSLGELDAGRRAVTEATGAGFGTVRLASETFLTFTGPLAAYRRAHPDIDVELHQLPAAEMARSLQAQDVDLCIASQPIAAEGLESVQLFDEPVGVGTSLGHPLADRSSVTIDELADESFISAGKGHWQRRLLERLFAGRDLTPTIVCEVDSASASSPASLGTSPPRSPVPGSPWTVPTADARQRCPGGPAAVFRPPPACCASRSRNGSGKGR